MDSNPNQDQQPEATPAAQPTPASPPVAPGYQMTTLADGKTQTWERTADHAVLLHPTMVPGFRGKAGFYYRKSDPNPDKAGTMAPFELSTMAYKDAPPFQPYVMKNGSISFKRMEDGAVLLNDRVAGGKLAGGSGLYYPKDHPDEHKQGQKAPDVLMRPALADKGLALPGQEQVSAYNGQYEVGQSPEQLAPYTTFGQRLGAVGSQLASSAVGAAGNIIEGSQLMSGMGSFDMGASNWLSDASARAAGAEPNSLAHQANTYLQAKAKQLAPDPAKETLLSDLAGMAPVVAASAFPPAGVAMGMGLAANEIDEINKQRQTLRALGHKDVPDNVGPAAALGYEALQGMIFGVPFGGGIGERAEQGAASQLLKHTLTGGLHGGVMNGLPSLYRIGFMHNDENPFSDTLKGVMLGSIMGGGMEAINQGFFNKSKAPIAPLPGIRPVDPDVAAVKLAGMPTGETTPLDVARVLGTTTNDARELLEKLSADPKYPINKVDGKYMVEPPLPTVTPASLTTTLAAGYHGITPPFREATPEELARVVSPAQLETRTTLAKINGELPEVPSKNEGVRKATPEETAAVVSHGNLQARAVTNPPVGNEARTATPEEAAATLSPANFHARQVLLQASTKAEEARVNAAIQAQEDIPRSVVYSATEGLGPEIAAHGTPEAVPKMIDILQGEIETHEKILAEAKQKQKEVEGRTGVGSSSQQKAKLGEANLAVDNQQAIHDAAIGRLQKQIDQLTHPGEEVQHASKIDGATQVAEQPSGAQGVGGQGSQGVGLGQQGPRPAGAGQAAQEGNAQAPQQANPQASQRAQEVAPPRFNGLAGLRTSEAGNPIITLQRNGVKADTEITDPDLAARYKNAVRSYNTREDAIDQAKANAPDPTADPEGAAKAKAERYKQRVANANDMVREKNAVIAQMNNATTEITDPKILAAIKAGAKTTLARQLEAAAVPPAPARPNLQLYPPEAPGKASGVTLEVGGGTTPGELSKTPGEAATGNDPYWHQAASQMIQADQSSKLARARMAVEHGDTKFSDFMKTMNETQGATRAGDNAPLRPKEALELFNTGKRNMNPTNVIQAYKATGTNDMMRAVADLMDGTMKVDYDGKGTLPSIPSGSIMGDLAPRPMRDLTAAERGVFSSWPLGGSPSKILKGMYGFGEGPIFKNGENPLVDGSFSIAFRRNLETAYGQWARDLLTGVDPMKAQAASLNEGLANQFVQALIDLARIQDGPDGKATQNAIRQGKIYEYLSQAKGEDSIAIKKRLDQIFKDLRSNNYELIKQGGSAAMFAHAEAAPGSEWQQKLEADMGPDLVDRANRMRSFYQYAKQALDERGIPTFGADTSYTTHAGLREMAGEKLDELQRLLGSSGLNRTPLEETIPNLLRFGHRDGLTPSFMPVADAALESYIPSFSRKIAYQDFLNKWGDAIEQKFPTHLSQWMVQNLNNTMFSTANPGLAQSLLNGWRGMEYAQKIGLSLSTPLKHAMKIGLEFSNQDLGDFAKGAMQTSALAVPDAALENPKTQKMMQTFGIKPDDVAAMKTAARVIAATKNATDALTGIAGFQSSMGDFFSKSRALTTGLQKAIGSPTSLVEYLTTGQNIFAHIAAGEKAGLTDIQTARQVMQAVLDTNFRGIIDSPMALHPSNNPAINDIAQSVGMFTSTPHKLAEQYLSYVMQPNAVDSFGTQNGVKLARALTYLGFVGAVGSVTGKSLLPLALHTPHQALFEEGQAPVPLQFLNDMISLAKDHSAPNLLNIGFKNLVPELTKKGIRIGNKDLPPGYSGPGSYLFGLKSNQGEAAETEESKSQHYKLLDEKRSRHQMNKNQLIPAWMKDLTAQ